MQTRAPIVAFTALFGLSGCSTHLAPIELSATPADATLITLKVVERPLVEVVRTLQEKLGVGITVDDKIDQVVSIQLEDVELIVALGLLAEVAECVVIKRDRNDFRFEWVSPFLGGSFGTPFQPIQQVIEEIASQAGVDIVVAPGVEGMALLLRRIPWQEQLAYVCRTSGCTVVEEHGILRVEPRRPRNPSGR